MGKRVKKLDFHALKAGQMLELPMGKSPLSEPVLAKVLAVEIGAVSTRIQLELFRWDVRIGLVHGLAIGTTPPIWNWAKGSNV